MSNVVQFLEALARNPQPLSAEEFANAVTSAELESAAKQALLGGDAAELSKVLGGRATMLCFVAPAENDEPQEGEEPEQEESPEQEITSRVA